MSTVMKKILMVLVALTLPFALIGCAGKEELTQKEIDQIVDKAAIATAEANTYKFDMYMPMTIEVIGGPQPGEMTMAVDATGAIDNVNKEMQMIMDMMTIDVPGHTEQEMAMEIYIVGEWMYVKMDIPVVGEQWVKVRLTEEIWEEQNQVEQQIEFLKTVTQVSFLHSKNVGSTECYVMEIVPSMEALGKLLSQTPGTEDIDWGELDLAALFKEMSIKEWIAKDSYLLMKSQVYMLIEMSPEDVGASEEDFEKMTMDMNIEMRLYGYNEAVSIELPEEAATAQEIPGQK